MKERQQEKENDIARLKQQMADMQKNFQLILQKIDVSKLE
jgi:hypothetical protein